MAQRNETIDQLIRSLGVPEGSQRSAGGDIGALIAPLAGNGTTGQQDGGSTEAVIANTTALTQLQALMQTLVSTTTEITKASASNTATSSGSSGSSGDLAKTIAGAVTGGLGLNPIVSGLLQLFGGGGQTDAPAPLTKFSLPSSLSLDAGITGGATGPVDYGQNGLPRSGSQRQSTNVTVQVNALDSRSILDRSDDIASAVRRAMLESSSLNDVVSEI
jgi:hypothetical protein